MELSNNKHPLTAGEHFAAINNINIHYYVSGSGPVLLLPSPGWGPSVDYIKPLLVFEQYFTMVYFDTRHSGQSSGPEDPAQYAIENFVEDIEALRIYLNQSKIFLAGHSGGGHQVLAYGIQHTNRLLGIIAIDAIAAPDATRGEELMKRISEKQYKPFYVANPSSYKIAAEFMTGMGKDKTPRTVREIIDIMGGFYFHRPELASVIFRDMEFNDQVFAYTQSTGFQGKNLLSDLHRITVPTLVIAGDDDFICDPVTQATRIHDHIGSSQLVIINDCGHFPWIEQPAAFYSACESWFQEQNFTKYAPQIR
jgi:proline iminopeptidase